MPDIGETPPPAKDAELPSTLARDTEVVAAISAHAADTDPHTGYQKESEKGQPSGYAGLDANSRVAQDPKVHSRRGASHQDLLRPYNVIAETVDMGTFLGGALLTSGTPLVVAIVVPANSVVNTITFYSGSTGLTRGSNSDSHLWAAIAADSDYKIKGVSADDTSGAWGTNSAHAFSLAAAYNAPASDLLHWLILMVNRGTGGSPAVPNLMVAQTISAVQSRALTNASSRTRCFNNNDTNLTTAPSVGDTVTAGVSTQGSVPYATIG